MNWKAQNNPTMSRVETIKLTIFKLYPVISYVVVGNMSSHLSFTNISSPRINFSSANIVIELVS